MAEVTINPGETATVVDSPGPNDEYNVRVTGAPVYLSHNPRGTIREGKKLDKGDRVKIANTRGKGIYAKVPATASKAATVEIDTAGFDLTFLPRSILGTVETSQTDEAPPAADDEDSLSASKDVAANGDYTASLTMPSAPEQVVIHAEGAASYNVTLAFNGTTVTTNRVYSSDASNEVFEVVAVPIPGGETVDVTVSDTSGGANNTVDVNAEVV